jgi:hypothetical protein
VLRSKQQKTVWNTLKYTKSKYHMKNVRSIVNEVVEATGISRVSFVWNG